MTHFLLAGTQQGVVVLERDGDRWQEANHSLQNRRVESLSTQGNSILAGTTEGLYRSEDLGETWTASSTGLTEPHIRWLSHHPGAAGVVLAGTEPAAIFVSQDGGQTWRECPEVAALRDKYGWYLPYSPGAGCVRGFAFHGQRVYAAVEVGGLLRSDDAGETWRLVEGSSGQPRTSLEGQIHPDVHSVAVHPSSPDLILAPTGGGFFRSEDGGRRWKRLYPTYCRAVWVDPAQAAHMLLGPADSVDRNGRIEETQDAGLTWQGASPGLSVPWPRHMVNRFLETGFERLAVLSNGELLASPLGTLAWKHLPPQDEWVLDAAVIDA
jgi:photosystem II stability/assembly factor-like uncharacterized protein